MSHSLNETEALCRKAARGAGYGWGLAEDAGRAARYLCRNRIDGCAALAGLLQAVDSANPAILAPDPDLPAWAPSGGVLCPIASGTALADGLVPGGRFDFGPVCQPLLLLPFVAAMSRRLDQPLRADWAGDRARLDAGRCRLTAGSDGPIAASFRIGPDRAHPLETDECDATRAHPSVETYQILTAFAARTYAPATEASRLAGAGAGLNDND